MPKQIEKEPRKLDIRKADNYGNYHIYLQGGGEIPKQLKGLYTSINYAKRDLDAYLATQGIIDEKKKIQEEIKSITPLDHEYDEV